MRWILDSCTLIYLTKTDSFARFIELIEYPVVIDTSVHKEVIINGKAKGYKDALNTEKNLKRFRIPVISIDISNDIEYFKDPGETSCYLLAKDDGICLTSDERAYKKFKRRGLEVMRLDTFFFQKCIDGLLTEQDFINILEQLEFINATKPKSILFFVKKLKIKKEDDNND